MNQCLQTTIIYYFSPSVGCLGSSAGISQWLNSAGAWTISWPYCHVWELGAPHCAYLGLPHMVTGFQEGKSDCANTYLLASHLLMSKQVTWPSQSQYGDTTQEHGYEEVHWEQLI